MCLSPKSPGNSKLIVFFSVLIKCVNTWTCFFKNECLSTNVEKNYILSFFFKMIIVCSKSLSTVISLFILLTAWITVV